MAGIASRVPREIKQGRLAIPVIGASEIPRIQFSSGSARALEAFSRDMFTLSDGFQDQLDAQAEAEATTEGALAGAAGEFELRDYGTIRGRAFNKAAVETFVTTVETNAIFKVAELQSRFGSDPAALERELAAYGEGVAREVEKVYAPAGAAFRQRLAVRSLPAIEAARDARFQLTRSEADAALIQNEIALKAEISSLAPDLFSDNPARSSAAARAVGSLQGEVLRIYDAVDPTTGRPLYTAEEKAKAKVAFYEDVMQSAALGWFDQQEDKAGAYLKFVEEGFTINLETPGADLSRVVEAQGEVAGIRRQPIKPALKKQLAVAAAATGDGVTVRVTSGGQPSAAEVLAAARSGRRLRRTGSTRHDHGEASDLVLVVDGQAVTPAQDRELYLRFAENAAAAGATGIGIDDDFIHVGGGSEAAWGYGPAGGRSRYLPDDFKAAIERGRQGGPLSVEPVKNSVDVRKALGPEAMAGIEAEMRARINFRNSLADRQVAQEEKDLRALQDANEFELTNRLYGGATDPETGEALAPLTREEVTRAVERGTITPDAGKAIVKAMTVDKPATSNPAIYRDALARLYAGENIYHFVLQNTDKLSASDAAELLGKNQTLNVAGAGGMSKEEQFHFDNLQDLLTPDSIMAKIDPGAEDRKYLALDEYRRRVKEGGEAPRDVAADLRERAKLTFETMTNSKLDTMPRPRFSVPGSTPGFIDLQASARALVKAHEEERISTTEFTRQKEALREWSEIQSQLMRTGTGQ